MLTRRSLNLAACGGKRARKKRKVTIRAARVKLVPPGDRRQSPLHARRVGCRTARLAVAHDGGRTRERRRGAHRKVVRAALDDRRVLQGAQVRHGRRRSAVRRRRRPSKVPRLRRHHRLPGPPTHGAGQARRPRRRGRRRRRNRGALSRPRRTRHGQEQGAARKPRRPDLRGRRRTARGLHPLQTPAVAQDRSGRATATSELTFKSTKRYGTTTCSRTQQWGVESRRAPSCCTGRTSGRPPPR